MNTFIFRSALVLIGNVWFAFSLPTTHAKDLLSNQPIGRLANGNPILAWGTPRSETAADSRRRVIRLDLSASEASDACPANEQWLGLVSPLADDLVFPPPGPAFLPPHAEAHAIWRWIGLSAPDLVVVPDSPAGKNLAAALAKQEPAGVGLVPVASSYHPPVSPSPANLAMAARLARSPDEILTALLQHYGKKLDGNYIDALALITRLRFEGEASLTGKHSPHQIARDFLTTAKLPTNSGHIAGTLLFGEIAEPWAHERVLAVAELAFAADGTALEAMPLHNEMSDAFFMGGPLLARAGSLTGNDRYFDQCLRHVRFMHDLCLRPDGLYRHSPLNEGAWGRGNGFPALGLAIILDNVPGKHPHRTEFVAMAQQHLQALAPHQDADGLWHNLIDRPESYAEFTATAMIGVGIATGLRQGWLEENEWQSPLLQAWQAIKARIDADGLTITNVCTGTGKQKKLEDYYFRDAILGRDDRGAAMACLLAMEMRQRVARP
jgi:unsaturated rhamnogalacturonyl hydrolase